MILCSRSTHYVLSNSVTLTAGELLGEQSLMEYTFKEVLARKTWTLSKCFISLINYILKNRWGYPFCKMIFLPVTKWEIYRKSFKTFLRNSFTISLEAHLPLSFRQGQSLNFRKTRVTFGDTDREWDLL